MIAIDLKTDLELKLERAKQGYERLEPGLRPFAFPERSLVREEVIERYQKGLDLFTEVRRTQAEYEHAVAQHRRALPGLKQFHTEALHVARQHFGADAEAMATFCAPSPARGKRRRSRCADEGGEEVVTTVVEEVIVERTEAPRGCHPRRGGGRRRSTPGEPLQVVGSPKKQRCRSGRR